MKRRTEPPEPPRPLCATCGEAAATHEVNFEARQLVLDRDAGVGTRAYWAPSYKSPTSAVRMLLCPACMKAHVLIETRVQAVATAKERS